MIIIVNKQETFKVELTECLLITHHQEYKMQVFSGFCQQEKEKS